ncbi:MAG: hypothetical protein LC650_00960 [Actinobacteria bacterium]|nr:hypothetical protein [Actinomycetota bacterium]
MFLLGAWKNFEELEECLTMEELVKTFNKILTRRNEEAEFQAKIAGAEMKGSTQGKPQEGSVDSLKEKVRARIEAERQDKAKKGEKTEFTKGIGYKVIGG